MSAWQSNFAATFHRKVRWWPVRGNCETSPLRAVASRVKPSFPSELSSSVASSQRMKATRLSLKVQRFAGPVPRNSALPSPRYVRACSDRSATCAEDGDPWPRLLCHYDSFMPFNPFPSVGLGVISSTSSEAASGNFSQLTYLHHSSRHIYLNPRPLWPSGCPLSSAVSVSCGLL